jgi:hypothetical protein
VGGEGSSPEFFKISGNGFRLKILAPGIDAKDLQIHYGST